RKRDDHPGRPREGPGFRAREGEGRRGIGNRVTASSRGFTDAVITDALAFTHVPLARDAPGRDPRHGRLYFARAGAREGGRPPHRHLVFWLRALRVPHRETRVRGGDGERHDRENSGPGSRLVKASKIDDAADPGAAQAL